MLSCWVFIIIQWWSFTLELQLIWNVIWYVIVHYLYSHFLQGVNVLGCVLNQNCGRICFKPESLQESDVGPESSKYLWGWCCGFVVWIFPSVLKNIYFWGVLNVSLKYNGWGVILNHIWCQHHKWWQHSLINSSYDLVSIWFRFIL